MTFKIRYTRTSSPSAQETAAQTFWKVSRGSSDPQYLLNRPIRSLYYPLVMFHFFEKKYYWVEKDQKGQMFLFRKKRKPYTYEKKIVKTREKDDHGFTCNDPRYYDHACKDKHRHDNRKSHEHVHHHCSPGNAPPQMQQPCSNFSHKKYAGWINACSVKPHQPSMCHPCNRRPSPQPQQAKHHPSSHPCKTYRPVDSHLKLEKIPVNELHQHGTRLESVKLERYRPEREGDFPDLHDDKHKRKDTHKHHERPRGRPRHRHYDEQDDHESDYDSCDSTCSCSHIRTGVRTFTHDRSRASPCSRGRSRSSSSSCSREREPTHEHDHARDFESAVWDQDLGAWVVKRGPSVRFE